MKFLLAKYILLLSFLQFSLICKGQESPYRAQHIQERISMNIYAAKAIETNSTQLGLGYNYDFVRKRRIECSLGFNYDLSYRIESYHHNSSLVGSHNFKRTSFGHRAHFPIAVKLFLGRKLKFYYGIGYHPGYFLTETNNKYKYQFTKYRGEIETISPEPTYDPTRDFNYKELVQNVNNLSWTILHELYTCVGYNLKKSRIEMFLKTHINSKYYDGYAGIKYHIYLSL